MSAITSIGILVALAGLAKAIQPLGARLRDAAKQHHNVFGEATRRALQVAASAPRLAELPSPRVAAEELRRLEVKAAADLRSASHAKTLDNQKTATIAAVLQAPLVVEDTGAVHAAIAAIEAARSNRELAAARADLHDLVAAGHRTAWLAGLQDVTQRAFKAIGFQPLRAEALSDREVRLSAVDGDGKVLVSELKVAKDGTPSMATEVVNGCGPECEGILQRFEAALAEHVRGVTAVRKPTGGVLQLEAAKAFVRRHVRRAPLASSAASSCSTTTSTSRTTTSTSSPRRSRRERAVLQKRSRP